MQVPGPSLQPPQIGANVQPAKILHMVNPKYPDAAKKAGVEGTVVLHAKIEEDGALHDLTVVSGPSELTQAALDAAKQWKYQTTLIAGKPVTVDTTISVVFNLHGKPAQVPPLNDAAGGAQNAAAVNSSLRADIERLMVLIGVKERIKKSTESMAESIRSLLLTECQKLLIAIRSLIFTYRDWWSSLSRRRCWTASQTSTLSI
jgi:protein TonB